MIELQFEGRTSSSNMSTGYKTTFEQSINFETMVHYNVAKECDEGNVTKSSHYVKCLIFQVKSYTTSTRLTHIKMGRRWPSIMMLVVVNMPSWWRGRVQERHCPITSQRAKGSRSWWSTTSPAQCWRLSAKCDRIIAITRNIKVNKFF